MSKTPRIPIPPEVRKYVFNRDNYQCQSCGQTNKTTNLTIDHIIPLAAGGQNDISNYEQELIVDFLNSKNMYLLSKYSRQFSH